MADVVVPLISADKAAAADASDLVDGLHTRDLVDRSKLEQVVAEKEDGDADFSAFKGGAQTLEGETVADAQLAAAAEVVGGNAPVVDNPSAAVAAAAAALKESPSKEAQSNDPRQSFVTPKDFELLKVIGMGAFGKVLQVKNRQSGQILAMKVISKRLLKRKQGYIENIQAERNILTRVKHPFVVTMHCSFQTKEKLFIIMDFLAGGELFLRLGREGIFLEKDAAFFLAEIVLGLDHLHNLGILHRDLKPENILLGHDGHICLTDFGLAKDFGPDWDAEDEDGARASTICGTQEYMSPEMLSRQRGYGKATDYWSLGCIAYEMLNGLPPFSSKQGSKELFKKIMSEKVKMPPGSTASACKLLKGLLNRNPDARYGCAKSTMFEVGGVAGLKQCVFFEKIDWFKLERKELKPPYDSSVDSYSDLRHFHDEFTSMPLPRSVREMSDLDVFPRRVDSQAFRGFSFIQPDFSLPKRDESDVEKYWNAQAEGDAESDSDVASSKLGVDETTDTVEKVEPEKKKRPPRKRKKKEKIGTPAASSVATASTGPSEHGDPVLEEKEISAVIVTVTDEPAGQRTATTAAQSTQGLKNSVLVGGAVQTSLPTSPAKTPTQLATKQVIRSNTSIPAAPSKRNEDFVWRSIPKKSGGQGYVSQHNPSLNSNQKASGLVSNSMTTHPIGLATTPKRGWGAVPSMSTTPQRATPASKAKATPGSAVSASSIRVEPSSSPWSTPAPPSADHGNHNFNNHSDSSMPSPSSNWRDHSSPQVKRALNLSVARSSSNLSSTTSTSPSSEAPQWPSLNDFPAVTTLKGPRPQNSNSRPPAPKLALKGAWATKAKQ